MLSHLLTEISRWAIPVLLLTIPLLAITKKVNVYESFVDGAATGFETAIKTIPYLVAMFLSLKIFRVSGAMELFSQAISPLLLKIGVPADVVPLALMRPLSGGAALGVSAELIKTHGPDSFIGRLASTMLGSTDTTFYVLALYFGSVGIKKYRYAPVVGLLADFTTFMASVYVVRLMFG